MSEEHKQRIHEILSRCFTKQSGEFEKCNVELRKLCDDKSFWSAVYKVELNWNLESSDNILFPKNLLIKLPIIGDNAKGPGDYLFQALKMLTKTEVLFYNWLGNREIKGCPVPRCYLAEAIDEDETVGPPKTGCLVLEDIGKTCGPFHALDYLPGYTMEQLHELMKKLAHFHFFFIKLTDHSWKDLFSNIKNINQHFQTVMFERAQAPLLKRYGMDDKVGLLKPIFDVDHAREGLTGYDKSMPHVLVHGDMNSTNILWKGEEGSNPTEIASLIDFQLAYTGSVADDIARVLCLGMDTVTRRSQTQSLLRIYYDELSSQFSGAKTSVPFTFDQLVKEYNRIFTHSAKFSIFGLSHYFHQAYDGLPDEHKNMDLQESHILQVDEEFAVPAETDKTRAIKDQLHEYATRAQGIVEDVLSLNPHLVAQ